MKGKITVLGFVVLLLTASAYVLMLSQTKDATDSVGAFAPELAQRISAISRIEVQRGTDAIILTRDAAGAWKLATSDGYPASTAQVAGLVNGLASLEKDAAMTAKPEKFGELALAWPATEASVGALVRLFDTPDGSASSAPFAEYVIGQERAKPRTQYLRMLSETQCWRCRGSVSVDVEPQRWMDTTLLSLPDGEVHSAEFDGLSLTRDPYGKVWTATASEASKEQWTPERIHEAESMLPSWLSRLEFDDVRLAHTTPLADAPTQTIVFDSLRARVVVHGVTEGDRMWVRFEITPHEGAPKPDAGLNGEVNAKYKYGGDPQVPDWAAWNDAHKAWEFRLPAWKVQQLKFEPPSLEGMPPSR
ncbi:MAG: DUF4340 domain-containing protein [Phycisphaerales bacterium]|nr:DUF4340 domain-containing protein [Phycisphaerales bacterium]